MVIKKDSERAEKEARDRILSGARTSWAIMEFHMKHGDPNKGRKKMMLTKEK